MTSVVKIRTKRSGYILYAIEFADEWIPVLYDPFVELVTTIYPRTIIEFHRRRISTVDEFLKRLTKRSCPNPSCPEELATAIADIKSRERELNVIRKARA